MQETWPSATRKRAIRWQSVVEAVVSPWWPQICQQTHLQVTHGLLEQLIVCLIYVSELHEKSIFLDKLSFLTL
jgi:hypothetical protein